jgi:hypothetical protein
MLRQEQVDAFLAAEKRIPSPGPTAQIPWTISGMTTAVAVLPVEAEDIPVSFLRLITSYAESRNWNFVLQLENEQVYAWHFRTAARHGNRGCPAGFPNRVRGPHEHVWVDTHDLTCARPLPTDSVRSTHRECFEGFCAQTNITVELGYAGPPAGEQMAMLPSEGES